MSELKNLLDKDGYTFTANIRGEKVEGKIRVCDGDAYLCQNRIDGKYTSEKYGYEYSYCVQDGTPSYLKIHDVASFVLGTKSTTFTNLLSYDGYSYSAEINGDYVEGIIAVEFGNAYLLQNTKFGSSSFDKRGFVGSWRVGSGSISDLEDHGVTNFILKTKESPVKAVSPSMGIADKDGYSFTAKIGSYDVEGEIYSEASEGGNVYLLQNVRNGGSGKTKRSYRYSWCVGNGSWDSLRNNEVTDFKLGTRKLTFNKGDKVKIKDGLKSYTYSGIVRPGTGTIVSTCFSSVEVKLNDDRGTYTMKREELELLPDEKLPSSFAPFKKGDKVKTKDGLTSYKYGGEIYPGTGIVECVDMSEDLVEVRFNDSRALYSMAPWELELLSGSSGESTLKSSHAFRLHDILTSSDGNHYHVWKIDGRIAYLRNLSKLTAPSKKVELTSTGFTIIGNDELDFLENLNLTPGSYIELEDLDEWSSDVCSNTPMDLPDNIIVKVISVGKFQTSDYYLPFSFEYNGRLYGCCACESNCISNSSRTDYEVQEDERKSEEVTKVEFESLPMPFCAKEESGLRFKTEKKMYI